MKKRLFLVLAIFTVILSSKAGAACNHPIKAAVSNSYLYSDATYHIVTWHCTQCNITISNKYNHSNSGNGRCLCGYCYHPADKAINTYSQYVDGNYHITTWVCSLCNNTVSNKYKHVKNDGRCECGYCYHPSDRARNMYAQYVDDSYHIATWTCSVCNNAVSDKYRHSNDNNGRCKCGYCYHPSDRNINIYKQYIDNNYHTTTWICSLCSKSLSSKDRHKLNSNDACECGYASHYCTGAYCNYNSNHCNYSSPYNYNSYNVYNPYPTYNNYNNPYTTYTNYNSYAAYNPYTNYGSYSQPTTQQVPYFAEIQAGRCYVIGEAGCIFKKIYNTQTLKFEDHYCGYRGEFANMVGKYLIQNGNYLYDTAGKYIMAVNEM